MSTLLRAQLVSTAVAVALASDAASQVGSHSASQSSVAAEYQAHRQKFHSLAHEFRGFANDSVSFETRLGHYQRRKAEVEAHNARPDKTWVATVDNIFADYTGGEWGDLLGYRRHAGWVPAGGGSGPKVSSFLEIRGNSSARRHEASVKKFWNWRDTLKTLGAVYLRSQGGCGSCWAVAAVGAMEGRWEIEQLKNTGLSPPELLSFEQMTACTPNPNECGGQGGCSGATVELGLNAVLNQGGIVPESMYTTGYKHGGGQKCDPTADSVPKYTINGFYRLPTNLQAPLMHAISSEGPVAVSVDGSPFGSYSTGVFDGCNINPTVNHAVLLVAFGEDENGVKYYMIRNSWGAGWGEHGYMRILRFATDTGEAGHCGIDYAPLEGVGCKGGPKTLPVCGMCGILSDSSYPYGITHGSMDPQGSVMDPMAGVFAGGHN